jgi:hypothetical protein
MTGTLVRLALVVCWLGLLGVHAGRHLLPQLGLAPAQDASAILATRLDRGLTYELRWTPAAGREAVRVGTCRVSAERDDVGFRTSSDIVITDLRFVPGIAALRRVIPGASGKAGVRLRISELLDANYRLRRIEADGSLMGFAFSAEGPVDHRGLDLSWSVGSMKGRHLLAEVRPDRVAGGELSVGLPAGLQPGAAFTSRILSPDPVRMTAGVKTAAFRVEAREPAATAGGEMPLLRVAMQVDGRPAATLWCGDDGTVYRQTMQDGGLELRLLTIDNNLNLQEPLWPAR